MTHANPPDDHDMWPPDTVMAWNNRRLLAGRLRWPDGALDACERIDADHPGWDTSWWEANAWAGRPAGFYAQYRSRPGASYEAQVYGATPDDVRAEIELHPLVEPPPFRTLT